jgi:hypothetical protein
MKRLSRLFDSWADYWLVGNARLSLGVCRIAVFSMLLYFHFLDGRMDYHELLARNAQETYVPKGLLKLFGGQPLPLGLIDALHVAAPFLLAMAAVGLLTRAVMPLAVVSLSIVELTRLGWTPDWCHGDIIVFMCAYCLMFSRAGDALALDRLIFRARRKTYSTEDSPYFWPILLAQFLVSFMFFNSFLAKLYSGGWTLSWVFSDSLRNHLAHAYHKYAVGAPPAYVELIMGNRLLWTVAAAAGMFFQAVPMAAVFCKKRPRLRALCGVFFVFETIAIGAMMPSGWHVMGLPLIAFFIDWDHFWPAVGVAGAPGAALSRASRWRPRTVAVLLAVAAVASYQIYTGLTRADRRELNFPFSSFTMYGRTFAAEGRAQGVYYQKSTVHLVASPPLTKAGEAEVWDYVRRANEYRWLFNEASAGVVKAKIGDLLHALVPRLPGTAIASLQLLEEVDMIPPYPAKPEPKEFFTAISAEIDARGNAAVIDIKPRDGGFVATIEGFDDIFAAPDPVAVVAIDPATRQERPVAHVREGRTFTIASARDCINRCLFKARRAEGTVYLLGPRAVDERYHWVGYGLLVNADAG